MATFKAGDRVFVDTKRVRLVGGSACPWKGFGTVVSVDDETAEVDVGGLIAEVPADDMVHAEHVPSEAVSLAQKDMEQRLADPARDYADRLLRRIFRPDPELDDDEGEC